MYSLFQTGTDILQRILDSGVVELAVGLVLGLSPTIFGAIRDRVKWRDEQKVVSSQAELNQSEAAENIVQAAALLIDQSQKLNIANAALIDKYETTLERQERMYTEERIMRIKQGEEIEALKIRVEQITGMMVECSAEIVRIVADIQKGNEINPQRLADLEAKWKKEVKDDVV
jgi:hypothetical protein